MWRLASQYKTADTQACFLYSVSQSITEKNNNIYRKRQKIASSGNFSD
jgi:23S rRNA maturation mini-RNase III